MFRSRKPNWWPLYVLGALLVVLLILPPFLSIPSGWQTVINVIALFVVFALIDAWVRRSGPALFGRRPALPTRREFTSVSTVVPPVSSSSEWRLPRTDEATTVERDVNGIDGASEVRQG